MSGIILIFTYCTFTVIYHWKNQPTVGKGKGIPTSPHGSDFLAANLGCTFPKLNPICHQPLRLSSWFVVYVEMCTSPWSSPKCLTNTKEIWSYCNYIPHQQRHSNVQLLPTWEWDSKWKLCDDGPKDPSVLPLQDAKEASHSFHLEITDSFRKRHAKHILFKALHQVWKVYSKTQPRRTFAWSLSYRLKVETPSSPGRCVKIYNYSHLWRLAGSNCRKFPGMVRLFLLASSLNSVALRWFKSWWLRYRNWTKKNQGPSLPMSGVNKKAIRNHHL